MREEIFVLPGVGAGDIPISLWTPTATPRGFVLVGHGLGVNRQHDSIQRVVRALTDVHELAVIAPDLPLHGRRNGHPIDPPELVARWQTFWADGGVRLLEKEWREIHAFGRDRFAELPCAYFGLSLGTQYGVVFLATAPSITSAVLGLFGSRPPPLTPVMNSFAPRVRCPVYFIQKQHDEIHPLETTDHLFSILGTADKVLDSSPGLHGEVSGITLKSACTFISTHM